jgi:DNA-binding NtrC family response regulator
MSVTVISVGDDPQLLSLRDAVLRSAGMRVLTASDYDTALSYVESEDADVLLLCYSMSIEARRRLAHSFRERHPSGRIIGITNMPQARPPIDADTFIYGIEGAEALIGIVCSQVEDKLATTENRDRQSARPESKDSEEDIRKRRTG